MAVDVPLKSDPRVGVLLALVLVGCGPSGPTTPCGSITDTDEDLSFAEATAVSAYAPRYQKTERETCAALAGLQIRRRPGTEEGWWISDTNNLVAGTYYTGVRVLELADVAVIDSVYVHEIGHALDDAFGKPPDADHSTWFDRGMYEVEREWRFAMVAEYRL